MKTIVIDDNAHQILLDWKKNDEAEGIEKPTHSQAIRWARDRIRTLEEPPEKKPKKKETK
jgi:hypothetical protein